MSLIFKQITASDDEHVSYLYGLDENGIVYEYDFDSGTWSQLGMEETE